MTRLPPVRRDKLGRRIGRNWWREFITDTLFCAEQAWQAKREAACIGHASEEREFALLNPRPTLKELLIANAGMSTERAA